MLEIEPPVIVLQDPQPSLVVEPEPVKLELNAKFGAKGDPGTVGPIGPGGAGASIPVRVFVPSGGTEIIEGISALVYRSTKWLLTVTDSFNPRYRISEVLAFHDGVDAHHTHYAMIGDVINFSVDVQLISGAMCLVVTNAEGVQLTVDAVRVGNLTL